MPDALRQRLFSAGFATITGLRADRWMRGVAQGRGVILTFHRVRPPRPEEFAPNRLLEVTPEYLDCVLSEARDLGVDVLPLDDVPGRLASRDPGVPPFLVLTFDDGFRDVVEHGWPVLRRHGVPWTFFIAGDYADGAGSLWWIELEEAIRALDAVPGGPDPAGPALPARTAAEKSAAFAQTYWRLRSGPEEVLRREVSRLAALAGVDGPGLVRDLCLGWAELKSLVGADPRLTIGAHTLSHPMLAKHPAGVVRREIEGSRARLEAELAVAVRHLAYPVGDPGSAGVREFELARELGFATAVTTRPGHLFAEHRDHLTALPRVSVNGCHQTRAAIRALLSGVPFLAWNRGRRLNVT